MTTPDAVLRNFMQDGKIVAMPAKRSRRLVLLDYIAQLFEVGVRYKEAEVNRILGSLHEDYATLRRYLVDEGFLSREHGEYWRTGGRVDDQVTAPLSVSAGPEVGHPGRPQQRAARPGCPLASGSRHADVP